MDNLNELDDFKASPALIEELYKHSIQKHFIAGSTILQENAPIRSIPIVIQGVIKVFKMDEEGREILLYYIKAGESCIMSFLGGLHEETSMVKAEVEEDAEILFLPVNKVSHLIKNYPDWLDYIFRLYHKRFEELLEIVNDIAFKKVDERLLVLLEKKKVLFNDNTLQITHEQLAQELGTARSVISRLLKQLEIQGKLHLGRNKITLPK